MIRSAADQWLHPGETPEEEGPDREAWGSRLPAGLRIEGDGRSLNPHLLV